MFCLCLYVVRVSFSILSGISSLGILLLVRSVCLSIDLSLSMSVSTPDVNHLEDSAC